MISFSKNNKKDFGKYVFIILLISVLLVLVWQNKLAEKQNTILLNDYAVYQQADEMMQNQEFDQSINVLEDLNAKYNNEFQISYWLGYSYLYSNKFESAVILYNKSLDLNPYLVENTDFMYQYAVALANSEKYEDSLIVINRILTYPIEDSLRTTLNEIINSINAERGTSS